MSGAERIAKELNKWAREGLDMMGGADGQALNRLLDDYFNCGCHNEQEGDSHPGCK
jgi:hypothetical protein